MEQGASQGDPGKSARGRAADIRVEALVRTHADFVFRSLRRLGFSVVQAEDMTQQVFVTVCGKLGEIEPSKERAFLYGVLSNLARHGHRSRARNREELRGEVAGSQDNIAVEPAHAEHALLEAEARAQLDALLDAMPDDLRHVFILVELEELTMAEAAELLQAPAGTVASRLRRARAWIDRAIADAERREAEAL